MSRLSADISKIDMRASAVYTRIRKVARNYEAPLDAYSIPACMQQDVVSAEAQFQNWNMKLGGDCTSESGGFIGHVSRHEFDVLRAVTVGDQRLKVAYLNLPEPNVTQRDHGPKYNYAYPGVGATLGVVGGVLMGSGFAIFLLAAVVLTGLGAVAGLVFRK